MLIYMSHMAHTRSICLNSSKRANGLFSSHHGETVLLHGPNAVLVASQVAGGCESSGKIVKDISLGLQIV